MEIFEASFALIHLGNIDFATCGFERLTTLIAQKLRENAVIAYNPFQGFFALVSVLFILATDWFDVEMLQELVEQVVELDFQEGEVA